MLIPDIHSIYNLCCSCKSIYQRVMMIVVSSSEKGVLVSETKQTITTNVTNIDDSICERVWKQLYDSRWKIQQQQYPKLQQQQHQQQQKLDQKSLNNHDKDTSLLSVSMSSTNYITMYQQRIQQDCLVVDKIGKLVQIIIEKANLLNLLKEKYTRNLNRDDNSKLFIYMTCYINRSNTNDSVFGNKIKYSNTKTTTIATNIWNQLVGIKLQNTSTATSSKSTTVAKETTTETTTTKYDYGNVSDCTTNDDTSTTPIIQRDEIINVLHDMATIDTVPEQDLFSLATTSSSSSAPTSHSITQQQQQEQPQQQPQYQTPMTELSVEEINKLHPFVCVIEKPFWRRRLEQFFQQIQVITTNYDDLISFNVDNKWAQYELKRLAKCLAAHLIIEIHFYQIMRDWLQFWTMNSKRSINRKISTPATPIQTTTGNCVLINDIEDGHLLEHGAILLARFIETNDAYLSLIDNTQSLVTTILDETANEIRQRIATTIGMPSTNIVNTHRTIVEIIAIVNAILYDELGISGNVDDYHNIKNSSIKAVLFEKKGIPISIAVIYKLLLLRVGVHSNIIGLPGHVVLGIPILSSSSSVSATIMSNDSLSSSLYIDVYLHGNLLSVDDCMSIVNRFSYDWDISYLKPLTTGDIIHRMINNLLNSCSRATTRVRDRDNNLVSLDVHEISLRRVQALEYWSHRTVPDPALVEQIIQEMIQSSRPYMNPIICRAYRL